jgi:hypothetical protein
MTSELESFSQNGLNVPDFLETFRPFGICIANIMMHASFTKECVHTLQRRFATFTMRRRHLLHAAAEAFGVWTVQPRATGAGTGQPGAAPHRNRMARVRRVRNWLARSCPAPGPQPSGSKSLLNRRVLRRWRWGCFVTQKIYQSF